ncbi:uncharacterized protein LOC133641740 [Entelurus aequoreus]|uniref:uncharacterized protein LOC133641740 n=1 Tax=Entelurus aequoreus TaxID=161455 RepID=UPI002B1DBA91|nr:uncharacterized protein LOC133641740 [Entelurus aequoreus]
MIVLQNSANCETVSPPGSRDYQLEGVTVLSTSRRAHPSAHSSVRCAGRTSKQATARTTPAAASSCFPSALNTPVADELPRLLKPVQTGVPGHNLATCSCTQHSSVPASPDVCLVSPYSLRFPGCLLDLDLPPGHRLWRLAPALDLMPAHRPPSLPCPSWSSAPRSTLPTIFKLLSDCLFKMHRFVGSFIYLPKSSSRPSLL